MFTIRSWRSVALGMILGLGACATTDGPGMKSSKMGRLTGDDASDEPCPEPPPALSRVEELRILSRATREVRANLLVQAHAGGQRVVATLHLPRLALAKAVLAAPRRARRRDPAWLARHLYTTFVELQCPRALLPLERAPTLTTLTDSKGHRHPLLSLERHEEHPGLRYRLVFAPPLGELTRGRWSLEIPTQTASLRFSWAPAVADQARLDVLPILFSIAQLRRLHLARWIALLGDTSRARRRLDDLLDCSEDPQLARRLATHLTQKLPPPQRISLDVPQNVATDEPGLVDDSAVNLRTHLALRVALFSRLAPNAARGIFSPKRLDEALTRLRSIAARLRRGSSPSPDDFLAFDRVVARGLAEALSPTARLYPQRPPLVLETKGLKTPSTAHVEKALRLRVAAASRDLEPRWISAGKRTSLDDLYPVLHTSAPSLQLFAATRTRLGAGYWHPGLPPGRPFKISFIDRGAFHWRDLATHAKTDADLRRIAQRVLAREEASGNVRARALAIHGKIALRGAKILKELLPLDPKSSTAPVILRALAAIDDHRVTALLHRYAKANDSASLHLAALDGLAQRNKPQDLPLLLAAARGDDITAARAALSALVRRQRGEAIAFLTSWIRSPGVKRHAALKIVAKSTLSSSLVTKIRRPLLRLVHGPRTPPEVLDAIAKLDDRRAIAVLRRLYVRHVKLRPALLHAAASADTVDILLRAGPADPLKKSLRHDVVFALARHPLFTEAKLRSWLATSRDPLIRGAAQVGLARLKKGAALLALGALGRSTCNLRVLVVPILGPSMDTSSRRRLLLDALDACPKQASTLWRSVIKLQVEDRTLLRAALGHARPTLRVQAALTLLGLRTGAALGLIPASTPAPSRP